MGDHDRGDAHQGTIARRRGATLPPWPSGLMTANERLDRGADPKDASATKSCGDMRRDELPIDQHLLQRPERRLRVIRRKSSRFAQMAGRELVLDGPKQPLAMRWEHSPGRMAERIPHGQPQHHAPHAAEVEVLRHRLRCHIEDRASANVDLMCVKQLG
jgi:hypothetical protein